MTRGVRGARSRASVVAGAMLAMTLSSASVRADVPAPAPVSSQASAPAASSALNSCFAPNELTARDGERRSHRDKAAKTAAAGTQMAPAISVNDRSVVPLPPIGSAMRGAIRRVNLRPGSGKLVALTIDLCEQAHDVSGYDGTLFDVLRREGVTATVFAGGKWLRSHPERTHQLLVDPAIEVASHGDLHRNLRIASPEASRDEIEGPQQSYRQARAGLSAMQCARSGQFDVSRVPQEMRLFRFPYGSCSPASLAAVGNAGLLAIQWSFSTGDPDRNVTATAMARDLIKGVTAGDIIIAHGNGRGWHTAEALAIALPKLKAAGFQFVTVSDLLAAGEPVTAATCYNVRPGDTDRYGPLKRLPPAATVAARSRQTKQHAKGTPAETRAAKTTRSARRGTASAVRSARTPARTRRALKKRKATTTASTAPITAITARDSGK